MTYLAVLLIGATLGAWLDRWWERYIADTEDLRSIEQRRRANQAINLRRWE